MGKTKVGQTGTSWVWSGKHGLASIREGVFNSLFFQVFLKYYQVEHLNLMVQQATQRVVLLQACVRGWLGAKRYRRILKEREHSALVLQAGEFLASSRQNCQTSSMSNSVSAVNLQAYRGHKVRKKVADDKRQSRLEAFVIKFQAGERLFTCVFPSSVVYYWSSLTIVLRTPHVFSVCRGYLVKKKYKEMLEEKNRAATKIQARYRGHKQRKSFKRKRLDLITV